MTALETLTKVCEIYGLRLITDTPPLNLGDLDVALYLGLGVVVVSPASPGISLLNAADCIIENLRVKDGVAA